MLTHESDSPLPLLPLPPFFFLEPFGVSRKRMLLFFLLLPLLPLGDAQCMEGWGGGGRSFELHVCSQRPLLCPRAPPKFYFYFPLPLFPRPPSPKALMGDEAEAVGGAFVHGRLKFSSLRIHFCISYCNFFFLSILSREEEKERKNLLSGKAGGDLFRVQDTSKMSLQKLLLCIQ